MLTLIVALPRTGKSQFVVSKLWEHKQQGKDVFVTNFKQTPAQIEATGFQHYGNADDWDWDKEATWRGDVSRWMDELPHGAVWMIDEAQDVFPQRGKDRQLPEWIKLFSKHGHKDLTIYVVTQDAMQLDVHLRRNANITLYMTRPLNMRKALIYTFRGSQEIPNDAWRRLQVLKSAESKKKFTYRKKWQDMYVSASAHDHIRMRFPLKLLVPVVAACVVIFLLWFAFGRLKSQSESDTPGVSAAAAAVIGADAPTAAASPSMRVATAEDYQTLYKPRIEGVPWSAPAYDGFEVTDYPRPYCYIGRKGCRCFSQQMSLLDISGHLCVHYVKNGYFDPHSRTAAREQQMQAQGQGITQPPAQPWAPASDPVMLDGVVPSVGTAPRPTVDPTFGTITRPTL